MLVVLLLWPLAAFGGAGLRTALPFGVVCLATAALVRPHIGRGSLRSLDRALLALLALVLLQLLPLPALLSRLLSPNAIEVRRAITLAGDPSAALEPITIKPSDTGWAALIVAASMAIFWMARHLFDRGGVRRVVRAICTMGLAVSVLAVAQAATAGRRIYWMFPTDHEGPLPFGPFVNRNHFATWVIMAVPLCFGYIAARSDGQAIDGSVISRRARVARLVDGRTAWLVACGGVMVAALGVSLSRSGVLAFVAAGCATLLATRGRSDATRYRWFAAAAAVAALAGVLWSDVAAIADRLATVGPAIARRADIWKETLPMVRDFWLTGTGAGTYQTAMLLYQQSDRLWYFNQAHNHYLQLAAEGGLWLSLPAAAALVAFTREALRRARMDRSGMFWIRSSALCGLAAVGLQSLWETGLTMPANAALAAVLAALALHQKSDDARG